MPLTGIFRVNTRQVRTSAPSRRPLYNRGVQLDLTDAHMGNCINEPLLDSTNDINACLSSSKPKVYILLLHSNGKDAAFGVLIIPLPNGFVNTGAQLSVCMKRMVSVKIVYTAKQSLFAMQRRRYMAVIFFRTIIMYLLIIVVMRFTGKRQVGELQLSELVVTILISELAAIPMQDTSLPVIHGVISIVTLVSFEVILSFIGMKSIKIRKLMEGHPSILINNGTIDQEEMQKLRFTIDDLIESLRQSGVLRLDQVSYAILETNGKLSVFLKNEEAPPTAKDLEVVVQNEKLPLTVVSDGRIIDYNLEKLKMSRELLLKIMRKNGCKDPSEIFYMAMDSEQNVSIVRKKKKKKFA